MNIEETMVYRGVTLRVRPGSKAKHDKMMRIGGACRKVWNKVLAICETQWQDYKAGEGDKPLAGRVAIAHYALYRKASGRSL